MDVSVCWSPLQFEALHISKMQIFVNTFSDYKFGLVWFCTILLLSWLARVLSRRLPRQDWVSPVDGSKPFAAMKPPHSHLKMLLVHLWIAAWWNFAGHLGSVRSKDMCILKKMKSKALIIRKMGQVVWVGFGNIFRDTSPVSFIYDHWFQLSKCLQQEKRMTFKVTRCKEIQWLEKQSVRCCLTCAISHATCVVIFWAD